MPGVTLEHHVEEEELRSCKVAAEVSAEPLAALIVEELERLFAGYRAEVLSPVLKTKFLVYVPRTVVGGSYVEQQRSKTQFPEVVAEKGSQGFRPISLIDILCAKADTQPRGIVSRDLAQGNTSDQPAIG